MDQPLVQEKNSRPTRVFIITVLVLLVVLFFVSRDMEEVTDFIRNSGPIGIVVSIGLYGVLGASVIPSEPLTILLSTVFGPFVATLVAGAGNTLAALIEYYVGTHVSGMTNFVEKKEKLPFGLGRLPINSPAFLILGRMMPGIRAQARKPGCRHIPGATVDIHVDDRHPCLRRGRDFCLRGFRGV